MRFVTIKTTSQQGVLCVHRLREGLKEERNTCMNRIRGLLAEFGLVVVQSAKGLEEKLSELLEDATNDLPILARLAIERAQIQWREIDVHLQWCDQRIAAHIRDDSQAQAAMQIMGIGPVTASAVVATVGDFKQFKNGAQFGAWLGLTPRQNSSGGKNNLGAINKMGGPKSTDPIDSGCQIRGVPRHCQQSHYEVGACAARAQGLAESGSCAGQQERQNAMGGAHQGR